MAIQLTVPTIACESCAAAVTQAIQHQEPNALVTIAVATKLVTVETTASEEEIKTAITKAGHEVAG
jgi:copper chaperone